MLQHYLSLRRFGKDKRNAGKQPKIGEKHPF
jgi:hypothetical protein